MNTYDWAKNELKLAREKGDYGDICYYAAEQLLEVFKEQYHSGYSAIVICSIFERLVKGKPLTPIKDEKDQWHNAYTIFSPLVPSLDVEKFPEKHYQHKRMSSLFKHVASDGTVSYHDNDRVKAYDQDGVTFSTAHIDDIINEYFPITFPYMGDAIKVNVEDINGDADYPVIRHIIDATRNGLDHVVIDRYFMSDEDWTWKEIDKFVYDNIKTNILKSKEENKNG